MIYYTSNLKEIEFKPSTKPMGQGEQGYVYKFDENRCIKTYIEEMPTFDPEMFSLFKKISLNGYSKLHELLYSDPKLQKVTAFIADYYPSDANNILFMPTEYTLYNLDILYSSIRILSKYNIQVKDLIPKNVILGKEHITVVDYDSYKKTEKDIEELFKENIYNLMFLFRSLYKEAFKTLGVNIEKNIVLSNYINYIFSNCDEPLKLVRKKLNKVPRPIDLLYEIC